MEEVIIYKYQLEAINEALRATSRLNNVSYGITAYDRMIIKSKAYTENAIRGDYKKQVLYK